MDVQHSTFAVRSSDIDSQKRLTLPALLQAMQEAAMSHVIRLGLSVWDLEPQQLAWVLSRQYLHIERLPRLGDTFHIRTYPAGFERVFTYRDFWVSDDEGQILAHSSSTWLLMDTATRGLRRITPDILSVPMPAAADCLPRPSLNLALPEASAALGSQTRQVNYSDLDFNLHLNNLQYSRWMLDVLPADVLLEGQPRHVDIQYRSECLLGEQVQVQGWQGSGIGDFACAMHKSADGKAAAAMRLRMA